MAGEDGTRSGIRKDCPLECCRAAALDWSALAACPGAHDIEGSRGTIWEGTEQDGACEGGKHGVCARQADRARPCSVVRGREGETRDDTSGKYSSTPQVLCKSA